MAIDPEVLAELERELERVRQSELRRQKPVPTDSPRLPFVSDVVPLPEVSEFQDWEAWWMPQPVQDWVEACSRAYALPVATPLVSAIGTIATALQGKAEVEIKPGWREPLSIFWILASPTGTMKSKVLDAAKAPLKAIEAADRELAQEQAKLNKRTRALYEGRCKKLRSMFASKGSLSTDQKNDLDSYEATLDKMPLELAPIKFVANINPALIPGVMAHNYEAEGIARFAVMGDEDTFLRNMMGRHSGHTDLEAILSGYTGGAIEMARKSVSTDAMVHTQIARAHMTMVILTQPHVVDELRESSVLADQGFWGRTIVTVIPRGQLPAHDAPPVPEAIQAAYDAFIRGLHEMPGGQVIRVPEGEWREGGALNEMYARIREDVARNEGGEGYATRTVGRVCRLWAMAECGKTLLADVAGGGTRPGGAARHVGIDLKYLFDSLYIRALTQSQDLQPATDSLSGLPHRALCWLRQSPRTASSGSQFSLQSIRLGLGKPRKDRLVAALDQLVEYGYIQAGMPHRNKNGMTTLTYIVLNLAAPTGSETAARADLDARMARARMRLVPPGPDEPPF